MQPPLFAALSIGVASLFAGDKGSSGAPKEKLSSKIPRLGGPEGWRTRGQQTRKGLEDYIGRHWLSLNKFGRCCVASHTLDAQGGRRIAPSRNARNRRPDGISNYNPQKQLNLFVGCASCLRYCHILYSMSLGVYICLHACAFSSFVK